MDIPPNAGAPAPASPNPDPPNVGCCVVFWASDPNVGLWLLVAKLKHDGTFFTYTMIECTEVGT